MKRLKFWILMMTIFTALPRVGPLPLALSRCLWKTVCPLLMFPYAVTFDNGIEPSITKQIMAFAGYKPKKVYIETLGGLTVSPFKDREKPLKMRARKERELLAFLLDAGGQGVTKEQIYNAIWSESESEDVKKLIGVNLAHIKKDLASLGIENPIISREKHYSICRDEIECDMDLFEEAAEELKLRSSTEEAQKLLTLYKGEYLPDFEAFWATSKRIKCREIYKEAVKYFL
jgi:LuxR family transcriptional regulator, maltose regulon positive regulatory protein